MLQQYLYHKSAENGNMIRGFHASLDRVFPLIQIEGMGTRSCLIGHPAVSANEVQAFGGSPVGLVDSVVHVLDEDGQRYVQVQATRIGHRLAFLKTLVLAVQDTLLDIAVHLPAIGGMGLLDIDYIERHL